MTLDSKQLMTRVSERILEIHAEIVQPPRGVDLLILGKSGLARTQECGAPLPPDAIAWGWLGALRWHWLHEWPWGMFTEEEYAALKASGRSHLAPDWRERFAPGAKVPSIVEDIRQRKEGQS